MKTFFWIVFAIGLIAIVFVNYLSSSNVIADNTTSSLISLIIALIALLNVCLAFNTGEVVAKGVVIKLHSNPTLFYIVSSFLTIAGIALLVLSVLFYLEFV